MAASLAVLLGLGLPCGRALASGAEPQTIHLVRADAGPEAAEHVFGVHAPLAIPSGIYHFWLQSEWHMTPFSRRALLHPTEHPWSAGGREFPLVEAGRVVLPQSLVGGADLVLELLHLDDQLGLASWNYELLVRRRADRVGEGVLMPEGLTVAALWHSRLERRVALSRPFLVGARQTVIAPLEAPAATTHLAVRLRGSGSTLQLRLASTGEVVAPDLVTSTKLYDFGFWYDLPAGSALLSAETPTRYAEREVTLVPGAIERVELTLEDKATLEVRWQGDVFAEDEPKLLRLWQVDWCDQVDQVAPARNLTHAQFRRLPATAYEVALGNERLTFGATTALEPGDLHVLALLSAPVEIRGAVTHDNAAGSVVTFVSSGGVRSSTRVDEGGAFELTAEGPVVVAELRPGRSEVALGWCFESPVAGPAAVWLGGSGNTSWCREDVHQLGTEICTPLERCADDFALGAASAPLRSTRDQETCAELHQRWALEQADDPPGP